MIFRAKELVKLTFKGIFRAWKYVSNMIILLSVAENNREAIILREIFIRAQGEFLMRTGARADYGGAAEEIYRLCEDSSLSVLPKPLP